MSLQWTLIAGYMYAELSVTLVLLLPFIASKRWHSFFKSRFLCSLSKMSNFYFKMILVVLALCFLDAIREMRKYGGELADHTQMGKDTHLDVEMQQHMRLFRSQRNFYISGFSLFLCLVIQRLITLISTLAIAQLESEAAIKQAKSASDAAEQLMKQQASEAKEVKQEDTTELTNEMNELTKANKKLIAESEASRKQAESVSREYDRLMEEHAKLQKEVLTSDKKTD